jgi:1,4-alpha-glucan branching enzyme
MAKKKTATATEEKKPIVAAKKNAPRSNKKALAPLEVATVEAPPDGNVWGHSLFSEFDVSLFRSGKHYRLYRHFGAHRIELHGVAGTYFAVWAPNAHSVSVVGNFNFWNKHEHALRARWDSSGIWEGFIPHLSPGECYKYAILASTGEWLEKADPFAWFAEFRPRTGSITWNLDYEWSDTTWMNNRSQTNSLNAPFSVYEVHLGSWRCNPHTEHGYLTYDEIREQLVPYVKEMGFTHVELMPVMEHPYDGSWGYQICGYFAPTSRFGDPQGFMRLVDELHQNGIGVILDWVPAHFPGDAHGLYRFDGTHLYEHEDPRKGFHPDWKSFIFNLGRNEVRSFFISNALFWLDVYHADGLRVDAVASMLYLDYSRDAGEWVPNEFGGRENLDNVSFLKEMNEAVYENYPGTQTIAEESTSWPGVSKPTYLGGLGFGMKWMMGWMNDTLKYFARDTFYRKWHQNELTFSLVYAFTENFMLPLSHDEVVHGKKSLVYKMPGDDWQRFANLRLLYLWMYTHPGTKLLFMGCEFAQTAEWNHEQSLDWHLLEYGPHQGIWRLTQSLNRMYRGETALYEKNFDGTGFDWIDANDHENSIVVYQRKGNASGDRIVIALNLTPVPRENYRIGLPLDAKWTEVLNTDAMAFGGVNMLNTEVAVEAIPWQGQSQSASVSLPPLGGCVFAVQRSRNKSYM